MRRPLQFLLVVGALATAFVAAAPWLQGITDSKVSIVFATVAFQRLVALVAGCYVVLVLIGFLFTRQRLIAWAFGLASLATILVLLVPALSTPVPVPVHTATQAASKAQPGENKPTLRILSWNTHDGSVPFSAVAQLAKQVDADIVILPNAQFNAHREPVNTRDAQAMRPFLQQTKMSVVPLGQSSIGVLAKTELGQFGVVDRRGFGVVLRGTDRDLPMLAAIHLPRPSLFTTADWRASTTWAQTQCSRDNIVMMGDFNATDVNLRGMFTKCHEPTNKLASSWPQALPPQLGAAIDHVRTSGNVKVTYAAVLSATAAGRTDHRPLFVIVRY